MGEDKKFKKYIYVSPTKRADIEEICNENKIFLQMSFINTYNFNNLFQEGFKNLNGADYLLFDLNSVVNSTKNSQDIVTGLTLMRKMYQDLRIIIIAEGYKIGNTLLRKNL